MRLEGLSDLALAGVPIYMGADDVEATVSQCSLGEMVPRIHALSDGHIVQVGGVALRAIHTPGHTAGGICFACGGDVSRWTEVEALLTGDTLFIGAFGKVGGGKEGANALYASLQRLASLPDAVVVRGMLPPAPPTGVPLVG